MPRATGARLLVRALEDEGVRRVFGIPGTHNIEIYDELASTRTVEPVLVTDEQAASFLADGYSRTSNHVGVLNLVPGAGVSHALSGIAEAFLDQVPMVVIACGIRLDTGASFQLHDVDQLAMLRPVTKEAVRADTADDIYPAVRRAFQIARRPPCGPVAVEIPANLLMLAQDAAEPGWSPEPDPEHRPDPDLVAQAVRLLAEAGSPALYVGAGAAGAAPLLPELAERLGAPVTTTFSGKGVFPEHHPLWLWNGFGAQAPPFVRRIMDRCDGLLAIGCRFAEVATGSYGLRPPERLIHVDVDPAVFHRNFPAALSVPADAALFVEALIEALPGARPWRKLAAAIADGHQLLAERRRRRASVDRVSPAALFAALERHARPDTVFSVDSGNGLFLAMEHLRLDGPGRFIGPVDYSCMGYSVPAAIGAAFASPGREVIVLPGDGALLMTGLELLTASSHRTAPAVFVLRDGKLGQIAQFQKIPMNRETCSVLPAVDLEGLATAVGCRYFRVLKDRELENLVPAALRSSRAGVPALVEVAIDYSEKTFFTRGVVATNFWRFPWRDRFRVLGRALGRRLAP